MNVCKRILIFLDFRKGLCYRLIRISDTRRMTMKREPAKTKKQHAVAGAKEKNVCGTLSHLAECRKMTAGSARGPELPGDVKIIVRKYAGK
jgi:hypothetical protein